VYTPLKELDVLRMRSSKTNGSIQKAGRANHVQGEGANWVLVAGGVLLSTLSVRLGCKLKQMFDMKKQNNSISKGLISGAPFVIVTLNAVMCAVCRVLTILICSQKKIWSM
jgi:hypothetical protein